MLRAAKHPVEYRQPLRGRPTESYIPFRMTIHDSASSAANRHSPFSS